RAPHTGFALAPQLEDSHKCTYRCADDGPLEAELKDYAAARRLTGAAQRDAVGTVGLHNRSSDTSDHGTNSGTNRDPTNVRGNGVGWPMTKNGSKRTVASQRVGIGRLPLSD